METIKEQQTAELETLAGLSRRHFFQYTGGLLAVGTFLSACHKDSNNTSNPTGTVDLGTGDIGILNYAYALEQLEAAFYGQVVATPYANISASEKNLLGDIWAHEVAHREFFKTVLGAKAIQALTPNFSAIDFTKRDSVLQAAQAFENLGVSAYNGAGALFTLDANAGTVYLGLAGKIVSVEARHAAYINDLLLYNSFATTSANGNISAQGLDDANLPSVVAPIANKYLAATTQVSGNNLPK